MTLKNILKAKLRDKSKIKDDWYLERIDKCSGCKYNSVNNFDRGFKYWVWDILNLKKPFCTNCGCEIKAKASEPIEECPKGYWKAIED